MFKFQPVTGLSVAWSSLCYMVSLETDNFFVGKKTMETRPILLTTKNKLSPNPLKERYHR